MHRIILVTAAGSGSRYKIVDKDAKAASYSQGKNIA